MTTLVEFQPRTIAVDSGDFAYLLLLNRSLPDEARVFRSITPTGETGVYEFASGPYVGRIGLPSGAWIDFESRFDFKDVLELIRSSARPALRQDDFAVPAEARPFLADALARAFVREVGALAAGGLAKSYESTRQTSPPYPGRIDFASHIGRFAARPDKLVTIARKLTTDIPENRALAAALRVLLTVPTKRDVADRLTALVPVFARVKSAATSAREVRGLALTNITRRYASALALAELVLSARQLGPEGVGLSGASVLFSMPKVWESYVATWVRAEWPNHDVRVPYRFALTNAGDYAEADAVVLENGQPIALYDAKYKWPGSGPSRDDLYQMIAYCYRLGLDEATLVYPAISNAQTVVIRQKRISVVGINPRTVGASPSWDCCTVG